MQAGVFAGTSAAMRFHQSGSLDLDLGSEFLRIMHRFLAVVFFFVVGCRHPTAVTPAICQAAEKGDVQVLTTFIQQGGNVNSQLEMGRGGIGLLHFAARAQQEQVVKLLLDSGADVNMQDYLGATPLLEALHGDTPEQNAPLIKLLLSHGADPNISNHYGESPLQEAAALGLADDARLLIQFGAKVNLPDPHNDTPVDYIGVFGRRSGDLITLEVLLSAGADPTRHSGSHPCALDAWRRDGRTDLIQVYSNHLR